MDLTQPRPTLTIQSRTVPYPLEMWTHLKYNSMLFCDLLDITRNCRYPMVGSHRTDILTNLAHGTEISPNFKLKNWTFPQFWALKMQICQKFVISGENKDLKELRNCKMWHYGVARRTWKGVLRAARTCDPFSGKCPITTPFCGWRPSHGVS